MAKKLGMGWHFESNRHSLAAKGIRTGRFSDAQIKVAFRTSPIFFDMVAKRLNSGMTERQAVKDTEDELLKGYKRFSDTDRDGVNDEFDCDPFDPTKQDSPTQIKLSKTLQNHLATPLLPGEEIEKDELYIAAKNDGTLYEQRRKPVEEMLLKKRKAGIYDSKLALISFKGVADDGAKRYYKEYGGKDYFTPRVRTFVAKEMLDDFEADMDNQD